MNTDYEKIMFDYIKMLKDRIEFLEKELDSVNEQLMSMVLPSPIFIAKNDLSRDEMEKFEKIARLKAKANLIRDGLEKAFETSELNSLPSYKLKEEVVDNVECKTQIKAIKYTDDEELAIPVEKTSVLVIPKLGVDLTPESLKKEKERQEAIMTRKINDNKKRLETQKDNFTAKKVKKLKPITKVKDRLSGE